MEAIEYGAFYGCSSLKKITFSAENNLKIINQNAFENCDLEKTVDLSAACVISDYAFAGNQKLEEIITGDSLLSIGEYAFAGCKKLKTVTVTAPKVKYGPYAFTGCETLTSFYVNAAVLPEGMFYECKALESVTIGPDVNDIGEFAFRDTAVNTIEVKDGNKAYKAQKAAYVLSADGKTLVAVAPTLTETFTAALAGGAQIEKLANGAFSHNTKLTAVELPEVTELGDYAFGSSENLATITLGTLEKIGEYAFFETAITQMPAFTADTEIGKYAFSFTDIVSVTIPDGMEIAEGVFSECQSLQSVTIGNDVTIGKYAFAQDKDNVFTVDRYVENDETYFYYTFQTALTQLTIGNNAIIGENAFSNAHSLETVTLGENAQIGNMAFYNNSSLRAIDLSKAKSIGEYAFSGDSYMICLDDSMQVGAVSPEGAYMYTYHAPKLESVDLTAAESIGKYAFVYCHELTTVTLGENVTEIPEYTFADCKKLANINLEKIESIGQYAFSECRALTNVVLSVVETVGEGAFIYNSALIDVMLNPEGCVLENNAFAECESLNGVQNLDAVTAIGDYAFLNTALTEVKLTAAEHIGTYAFMKPEKTPFKVTLGEDLKTLGDNPFAMCQVEFCIVETTDFNGTALEDKTYTFDISDDVTVIDGSLYCRLNRGMTLITYASNDPANAVVAEDTLRISGMAFAGSDVEMVTLPNTVFSIGDKAFYDCDALHTVVFGSYEAPVLEEEFDRTWYEGFENMPGTGDFGTYTDYVGNEVPITGMGLIPYYMWNSTDGMYSNVFYGANFVDHVGYVTEKLTMIRPVNGTNYDSFIYSQYFDVTIDGAQAPDKGTLETIWAIKDIPERVTYEKRAVVENARALYNKIATLEQQALVTNYADLISAEQRIVSLTPTEEPAPEQPIVQEQRNTGKGLLITLLVLLGIVLAAAIAGAVYVVLKARKEKRPIKDVAVESLTLLKEKLIALWAVIVPVAKAVWAAMVKLAKKAWPVIKKIAKKIWPIMLLVFNKTAQLCKALWQKLKPLCAKLCKKKTDEKPQRKRRRKVVKQRKPRKELSKTAKIVLIAVGAVLALLLIAACIIGAINGSGTEDPYQLNDADNYTVSVKFDANGGFFTTNTSVIVDAFDSAKLTEGIALLEPDNEARGNNAFTAVKNGYFLAGWYSERTQSGTDEKGEPVYTYSGKWDFAKDRLTQQLPQTNTSKEPVLTLYAAWVPMFEIQVYDLDSGELLDTVSYDPSSGKTLTMPAWDKETGAMEMNDLPQRNGYTFQGAYLDAAGTQAMEAEQLTHTGSVDYTTGTAKAPSMKLYTKWLEGEWYHIYNAEQFIDNASVVGNYVIHADLNFAEEKWPTSLMHGSFEGTIQGNGHTFKNIKLTQTNKSKTNAGLFGQLTDTAAITDVTFTNVTFTIKGGSRVAGTTYGLLSGTLSEGAQLTGVAVTESRLQIDSDCYFGTDDYTIGLICGMGTTDMDYTGITCEAVGDEPEKVVITVTESTVNVEIKE